MTEDNEERGERHPTIDQLVNRLEEKTTRCPMSGCWIWTAATNNHGYGQLRINKKAVYAHRLSWELRVGAIPKGLWVLHRCDVPSCINPSHLFLGTRRENFDDMLSKGRSRHGERHYASKLTDQDVAAILKDGRIHKLIAADYGLCRQSIDKIKRLKSWKHISVEGAA